MLVLPVVAYFLTYRLCKELSARDRGRQDKLALLARTETGGYVEEEAEELSPSP